MATPLRMPDMGTVEGDVTLVRWLKAEGDTVALGEPLFEVETDKGISEVEAAIPGVLERLVVPAGSRAGAGEVIALIRRPGEAAGEAAGPAPAAARPAAPAAPSGVRAPDGAPRKVPPAVRALAEKRGVDVDSLTPTGPGGLLTREDVLRAGGPAGSRAASAPSGAAAVPGAGPAGRAAAVPAAAKRGGLTRHQAGVARLVAQSHREKAIFHVQAAADMTRAIAFREQTKQKGAAVRYDALVVKAVAAAIAAYPAFRTWMKGEEAAEHSDVSVAFAAAVGDELYAPAVKAADTKAVGAISAEMEGLARKAADHALSPQDSEGSCFLVSNLGMFPISSFDAVIFPEHSAALAIGTITPTPVADGAGVRVAPLLTMTLSVDHRPINGKQAAEFLSRVKQILETGAFA
jgi:pyruvate dehydrogenase E2 component (dihydrolipoamide acetyltransferase)